MRPGEKILLQCPFIHHKSHTKWCKIQLQLYSQKTAHNYPTSGFNKINLKCAQHNCMDTALMMECRFIRVTIQNWESKTINWQWVSTPPASLVYTWENFKNNIRSNLHFNCSKNMSAGLPLLFSASVVSSNYPLKYSNFTLDDELFNLMREMNNSVPLILHPFHPKVKCCAALGIWIEQCSSCSRNLGFKRPDLKIWKNVVMDYFNAPSLDLTWGNEEHLTVGWHICSWQDQIIIQGVPGGMWNTSGECSLC